MSAEHHSNIKFSNSPVVPVRWIVALRVGIVLSILTTIGPGIAAPAGMTDEKMIEFAGHMQKLDVSWKVGVLFLMPRIPLVVALIFLWSITKRIVRGDVFVRKAIRWIGFGGWMAMLSGVLQIVRDFLLPSALPANMPPIIFTNPILGERVDYITGGILLVIFSMLFRRSVELAEDAEYTV
jgi:hypothetical protein